MATPPERPPVHADAWMPRSLHLDIDVVRGAGTRNLFGRASYPFSANNLGALMQREPRRDAPQRE